jgi:hypothetical protein
LPVRSRTAGGAKRRSRCNGARWPWRRALLAGQSELIATAQSSSPDFLSKEQLPKEAEALYRRALALEEIIPQCRRWSSDDSDRARLRACGAGELHERQSHRETRLVAASRNH